ncbi:MULTISPECIES: hypothetical protein [unclassified Plantibacter]|uniref:hypothetical protein n=1 Tax=unclassified Plantibacter TaxID=2624265 RepID=UPI003D348D44
MRWDSLFDDLEGQLDDELGADDAEAGIEEERLRRGRLMLRDRLIALSGAGSPPLALGFTDGSTARVIVMSFGKDWLVAAPEPQGGGRRPEMVVPIWAVATLRLAPQDVERSLQPRPTPEPRLTDRLTLSFVLRDLCRRRAAVAVRLIGGDGASTVRGTIDRVGRDHLDLAVHEVGLPRRAANVSEIRVVSFAALVAVEHAA